MTPNEFKAWFDGFTEAFEGRIPTKAQWTRIKERVAEIDGKPVTERHYIDRYWPTYRTYPYYPAGGTYWTTCTTNAVVAGQMSAGSGALLANMSEALSTSFNSSQAMNDLGRAEAASLT
jgi:hypothetical protein